MPVVEIVGAPTAAQSFGIECIGDVEGATEVGASDGALVVGVELGVHGIYG